MIGLVDDENVGNFEDSRFVHLHGVAHSRHDNHGGAINKVANRHVILTCANSLDNEFVVARAANEFDDLVERSVVLADDRERAIEDTFVNSVEVDAQTIAQERATRDRAHRIKCDDRDFLATTNGFARHCCNECALARAW